MGSYLNKVKVAFKISIGNHMGLSAIKKLHCNRQVIARGEAECNLGLLCVQFFKNCTQKHVVTY